MDEHESLSQSKTAVQVSRGVPLPKCRRRRLYEQTGTHLRDVLRKLAVHWCGATESRGANGTLRRRVWLPVS